MESACKIRSLCRSAAVPIIFLSATLPSNLIQSLKIKFSIKNAVLIRKPTIRRELIPEVRPLKDLNCISNYLRGLNLTNLGSPMIFCKTVKQCIDLSNWLNSNGFDSAYYHASMESQSKIDVEEKWKSSNNFIVVGNLNFKVYQLRDSINWCWNR
jgi:superfamily II DNA helicase RecQ